MPALNPSSFNALYDLACQRKGDEQTLLNLIKHSPNPNICDNQAIAKLSDDRILAELSKKVFQSGFVWRVVEAKWPSFEEVFWGFDIDKLIMMPDPMLEEKAKNPAIIRNLKKVWTIRDNAFMLHDARLREGCSFAEFIANWPSSDIIGLWAYLKKHGSRLGGNTGPYALRALGKDSFLLTRDVERYLREAEIVETGIQSKSALNNAQRFFNALQDQSGWTYRDLSLLVAFSSGTNNLPDQ